MNQFVKSVASVVLGLAGVAAVAALGYSVGAGKADALVSLLQEQRGELKAEAERLAAEVEELKLQIARRPLAPSGDSAATTRESESQVVSGGASPAPSAATAVVRTQESRELFGGRLIVSVVATPFEGSPLRNRAIFTLGSPGEESASFEHKDVGFAVEFAGYDVRVVSVDTFSVTFRAQQIAGNDT